MESKQGKCCGCLCSRSIGVKLVFFWISLALYLNYTEMRSYGDVATPWMTPILCVIAAMVLISFTVSFIPGCNTPAGRYMFFFWWFACVTMAWNIWWWYLLFNSDPEVNPVNWECNSMGIQKSTQAYNNCLGKTFSEKFMIGIPFFLADLWISWELYCW